MLWAAPQGLLLLTSRLPEAAEEAAAPEAESGVAGDAPPGKRRGKVPIPGGASARRLWVRALAAVVPAALCTANSPLFPAALGRAAATPHPWCRLACNVSSTGGGMRQRGSVVSGCDFVRGFALPKVACCGVTAGRS